MSHVNQRQVKYLQIDTLANLKLANPTVAGILCYCDALKTLYKYEPNGADYTANDKDVTITANAGNTRWVAIAWQYAELISDATIITNITTEANWAWGTYTVSITWLRANQYYYTSTDKYVFDGTTLYRIGNILISNDWTKHRITLVDDWLWNYNINIWAAL